jgi:hypothetical protein
MKSIKYFPFERNRYFYGKLLSVEDFETEQKYANNKRRIINRFIHGTGVVCGMNVIAVDDSTVSVEKGFALDFCGREILIDAPVTKKLAMLDGFDSYNDQDQNNSHLYLCVEYDETEKEPVHSITNTKTKGTDGVEYNKYAEGYHLYLSTQEPERDVAPDSFYEDCRTIYWGNRIRIKQVLPKYIESNSRFEMKIIVENMGQTKPFSFSYNLDLTCIQGISKGLCRITFDESKLEKAASYEFTCPLKTLAVKDTEGRISVQEGSFSLAVGGKKMKAEAKGSSVARIIEGSVLQEVIMSYYNFAMEEIARNSYPQGIYLAKIAVIKAGNTYVIDSIETMPFGQYIFSNSLAAIVNNLSLKEKQERSKGLKQNDIQTGKPASSHNLAETAGQVATGTAVLDLGIGGAAGQKFFSQEIVHGLGLGPVNITLGEAAGLGDDSSIIYGVQDIFDGRGDAVKAELAAKADVSKGTFVIGLRCLEPTNQRQVKVHWMAVKDLRRTVSESEQKTMNIKPDILNLIICETFYFEAVISGETESRVKWHVKEEGGGTIDENGMYTAPNKAGVYEVIAESMDSPDMKASAFIVVREA